MQQAVKTGVTDAKLTLAEVLDWLVEDRLVAREAADALRTERRYHRGNVHPLCVVAEQKWKKGAALLTVDVLSEWLAKRLGMDYLHIDPLKIDFTAVTEIMSVGVRHALRILPVAVTAKEAVIADAEPNVRDWEPELARIIKREIKRVIANPVDIERYQVEFYNLAKSIKGASKTASGSGLSNFEQLVELGKSDKLDANDAHVVQRGRLALAVRLRAARERHPRRAAPRARHRALPHRRRAAPGLPDPRRGARRDDQPHQDPGAHGRGREAPAAGRPHQDAHRGRATSSCASRACRPPSAKSW
jgi:hypothetical protein